VTTRATTVRPGAALAALAHTVRAVKGGDPLAAVTVIVPTNATGVMARRYLGRHGGVAAVDMVTLFRLAELLAGPDLVAGGRRPVSTPVVDLAVRSVLSEAPGAFADVAGHPSTVTALRDLHRELRIAGPVALSALGTASARAREAARVSSLTAHRLADDWYDEGDLLRRSIELLGDGSAPDLRRVVAFLPHVPRGLDLGFLDAIGAAGELHVILARTGEPAVDREIDDLIAALGAGSAGVPAEPTSPPLGDPGGPPLVISTTDADDEVRQAVRVVVDHARAGVPFGRMAVLWPADRPYARLVEHHLDTAGIAWNGRPGTLAVERIVPRFLLDLLHVDRRGLRRSDLFDVLADVPIRGDDGAVVPVGRWERVAREAGVARSEHWMPRLARYAAASRARAGRSDDGGEAALARADAADRLADFVGGLLRDLGHPMATRSWSDWADWCDRQVAWRLGERVLDRLGEAERLAFEHTNRVLDRLRHLDTIGGPVRRAEFRAVFATEFEVAPGRLGRIGHGVTIGSLTGAVGLDTDLTIVLGAADGLLPPAPATDPLIADADRRAAGLPTSEARAVRAQRNFLAVLETSPSVVIGVPRGDLRTTTERLPSRWLAAHLRDHERRVVSSHHAGLLATAFPAAPSEHRLRDRMAAAGSGAAELAARCVDDRAATRALRMRAARRSPTLTEYDGDLSGVDIRHFERPVSPSQLEAWAKCPHAYFVQYLLGVRRLDDTTDDLALSPIERGNVVHTTLDRFNRLVLDGELAQPGDDGWTSDHLARLLAVYDDVADDFERTGRTGRAAHWQLDREAVRNDLIEWFLLDGQTAAARGAEIVSSELRFGRDAGVTLPLDDGHRLAVHGSVDRVDRRRNGDLVVMDHKTGSDRNFRNVTADDPTEGGTKFQLPTYAAAALALFGGAAGEEVAVLAEYDFFRTGGYQRLGYTFDGHVWEQVARDLGHLVGGIESGFFPAVTGPPKFEFFTECHYCQPDQLGTAERFAEWDVKRGDARLAPWFADRDLDAAGDPDGARP
jgi:RecB family exonuclease